MSLKNFLGALILFCGFFSGSSNASVAHLVLNATPGDWISGGQQVDNIYSSADPLLIWNAARFRNIGTTTTPATNYIDFTFLLAPWMVADDKFTTLTFATNALGIPLTTGSYFNAQRAAFASAGHPGLDISYDHRGCNTLTGFFTINDLSFSGGGIASFSSSFSQSCDGGPLMSGNFEYYANRTTLNDIPEPPTIALLALGVLILAAVFGRPRYKATI